MVKSERPGTRAVYYEVGRAIWLKARGQTHVVLFTTKWAELSAWLKARGQLHAVMQSTPLVLS